MIYRGPRLSCGRMIELLYPPTSPLSLQQVVSLSQSSCVLPVELTDGRVENGGRGWVRSQTIRLPESLALYKLFSTLCPNPSALKLNSGHILSGVTFSLIFFFSFFLGGGGLVRWSLTSIFKILILGNTEGAHCRFNDSALQAIHPPSMREPISLETTRRTMVQISLRYIL
jgi:hypothetical protein